MTTRGLTRPPADSSAGQSDDLTALFERHVDAHPEDVAIEDALHSLTYAVVDRAANRLAHLLMAAGVHPGDRVAVAAHRSSEALVAFLGVLKTSAAYVPIDPDDPLARLEFMVRDTHARVVITQERFAPTIATLGIPVVALDPELRALDGHDGERPTVRPAPHDLAYVMYTSGSTGRPKGVAIEHRNVLRRIEGARDLMPRRREGMLQVNELDFDIQTWEVWGGWSAGARLVVAPPGNPEPSTIGHLLHTADVRVAHFSTGLFRQMVEARLSDLGALRLLLVSGDVMSPVHARRFIDTFPDVPLLNLYGPTEATVCCSSYRVRPLPPGVSVPIGRALDNSNLEVLDENRERVAPGSAGELYIGGACVAREYLNLPEQTSESFVDDQFRPGPDARMYRTGDRVRVLPDGDLDFIGRMDEQVKIRGFRIEPAEIEASLRALPSVQQTVVVPREDLPGHRRLVAYIVTEPGADDLAPIQRALEQLLPAHMIPSAFVRLEALPLSSRGKIDRAALPAPADARSIFAPPASPLERDLAAIWADVLQVDDVGADDDFVELGGDSLLAVRVTLAILERLGIELPLDAVFAARTVRGLARRVEAKGAGEPPGTTTPRRRRRLRSRRLPVTATQAQACIATELATGVCPYQFQALVHLEGDLDVETLERALTAVVARHEILHTRFVRRLGTWRQVIERPYEVRIPVTDLRAADRPADALAGLAEHTFAEPIAMDRLPLQRWRLVRLTDDHTVLLHAEHHLVHDGRSWSLFLDELTTTYAAKLMGNPSPQTEPALQFRDFTQWQLSFPQSPLGRAQLEYWRRVLAGPPAALALPTDHVRPMRHSYRGARLIAEIPDTLNKRLRAVSSEHGVTLFMTMLAAFCVLLGRSAGVEDLVVGSGVANRRFRSTERLIGMLVNTVALRVDLSDAPTVAELLDRVRTVTLEATANQDLPFEHVLEAVAPRRQAGVMPLYQVLFSFQDPPRPDLSIPGLVVTPDETPGNGSAKADLNVIVIDRRGADDALTVLWDYSTDLFGADSAQRMLDSFLVVLEEIVADTTRQVTNLRILPAADRGRLLEEAGRTTPFERDASIGDVFTARVREQPDAIAVAAESEALSYGELDRRANRLAHRLLRTPGLEPGCRVAVLAERSPAAVVAMLAILKAGAAYVMLDPSMPRTRIETLLSDSGAVALCAPTEHIHDLVTSDIPPLVALNDSQLSHEPSTAPAVPVAPTDAAYVAYTSGTTGDPKGVVVPHRAVVRLVRGVTYVDLDPSETLLLMAPLAFDASTFEIWGALLNGARLAIAPVGAQGPDEIASVVDRFGVTTLWLTAGLFHRVVDHRPDVFGRIHQLVAGGDVLSPDHVARALRALPANGVLVNGYGPTEGTTFTCCHAMRPGSRIERPVPIGRPIENTRVYVVGPDGDLAPPGVAGELWIGGDGIACGYLGAPELTEERFVPDVFGADPGARLYRTGDRVRRRRDGTLDFLGRLDRQVKIRGYRVEPAAVETVVLSHRGVRGAAVQPRRFGPDDLRLVAYVVLADDTSIEDVRSFVQARLPAAEAPTMWIPLDELPLGPTGKIDYDALPRPVVAPPATAKPTSATEFERRLIELWEEVLDVRPVSPFDDFFDLGGHSLLAIELFARIEELTSVPLPLATIFEAPSVRSLATLLASNGWDSPSRSLIALNSSGSKPAMFFVTAGDGNTVGFGALARRLGTDQPFYALQPRGLDGRSMLDADVRMMARHYVEQISTIQPTGPYVLGGRCFGTLIAYEMTLLLEGDGKEVALLVALDSVGPLWEQRPLANGLPFDQVMNLARTYAGADTADDAIFDDSVAADAFVAWLREPVTTRGPDVVNRYVHAAYRARPDLQANFALSAGLHAGLIGWSHIGGISEMGMNPALLPPAPEWASDVERSVDPRHRPALRRGTARVLDMLDVATRGKVRSLARRRQARLLELASRMVYSYRGGPVRAPIAVLRSEEYRDDAQLARWHGVQTGGITEHFVEGTHASMMREPDVASVAEAIEQCITVAFENAHGDVTRSAAS